MVRGSHCLWFAADVMYIFVRCGISSLGLSLFLVFVEKSGCTRIGTEIQQT